MNFQNEIIRYAVKMALARKGLTETQVAVILGVSQQAVSKQVNSGKFSINAANRWSVALGIPIETFLEASMPPPPPTEELDTIKEDIQMLKADIDRLKNELRMLKEQSASDLASTF